MPLILSVGYLLLIVQHFQGAEGGFGSLADVATLFQKPELLLAGWIHYLAFDLFIGAWEIRDSQRHGIPHLLMIPCLVMTFMLGPIGLLFYFAIRTAKTRALKLEERMIAELRHRDPLLFWTGASMMLSLLVVDADLDRRHPPDPRHQPVDQADEVHDLDRDLPLDRGVVHARDRTQPARREPLSAGRSPRR